MRMFWSKLGISPRTIMFSIAYAHDLGQFCFLDASALDF